MAEKLDPKQTVSFEELLLGNTITQEALVNLLERKGLISKKELLERKGLISKKELLEEIKRLKGQQSHA